MPLQNSLYASNLPKTKTFELDGNVWATDESTFKVIERQSSLGAERVSGWYFAFCVGAGTIVRVSVPETEN
jgi:hypothetical protein